MRTAFAASARNWLVLALVIGLFSLAPGFRSVFFTRDYLPQVFEQSARNIVLAVGMSFVIFTGGIDLSVGSVLALSGVGLGLSLSAQMPGWMSFLAALPFAIVAGWGVHVALLRRHALRFSRLHSVIIAVVAAAVLELLAGIGLSRGIASGVHVEAAICLCLLIGTACGFINGLTVSLGSVPPFVVTLGMMSAARGLTLFATDGSSVSTRDYPRLLALGHGPQLIAIAITVVAIGSVIVKQQRCGRYIFSIGGNENASRLSGVDVVKFKTLAYVLSGICAAIGAVMVTAMFGQASTNAASGAELEAIASVVIGGASLSGGHGSIMGAMVGALTITVITAGLILVQVPDTLQQVVLGVVIVVTVLADQFRRHSHS